MKQLYKVKKEQVSKFLLTVKNGMVITDEKIGTPLKPILNKKFNIQLFGYNEPPAKSETEKKEELLNNVFNKVSDEELSKNFSFDMLEKIEEALSTPFDKKPKEFEADLFEDQLNEATAYVEDKSSKVPIITVIAKTRGITVLQLAKKIIDKAKSKKLENAKRVGEKYAAKDKTLKILEGISEFQKLFISENTNDMDIEEKAIFVENTKKLYQSVAFENVNMLLQPKTAEELIEEFKILIEEKLS